ncbi:MAG: hypothetical protein HYX75_18370 [Acidobacteria bacterium]|nr:hypothetical protein [Acidobacteriota bacterium]
MPLALLGLVVSTPLTCCRSQDHRETTSPPSLVIAYKSTVASMDPITENTVISNSIYCNVFEPLVFRDERMRIRPLLAVTWLNPDDRTWVFKLRAGVRFHDGSPLRAEDVRYSLERARNDSSSTLAGSLTTLESVDVIDEGTVRIVTKKPYSMLLGRLVDIWILPAPRSVNEPSTDAPPGTGPYRLKSWKQNDSVLLEANPTYWGARPSVQRARFVAIPDARTRLEGLKQGKISILPSLEPVAFGDADLLDRRRFRLQSSPGLLVIYLGMKLRRENQVGSETVVNPFFDRRVREAVQRAIDVDHIVDNILQRNAIPATQIVAPGLFGYCDEVRRPPYDPEGAKKLLREAGYGRGFAVRLDLTDNRYRNDLEIGKAIANDLGKVGIRVSLNPMPIGALNESLRAHTSSFFMRGWSLPSADASGAFDFCVHTADPRGGYGSENSGGYSNPEVDRLIERSAETMQPKQRLQLLEHTMKLVMHDLPYVPLHVENNVAASLAEVEWRNRPDEFIYVQSIRFRHVSAGVPPR